MNDQHAPAPVAGVRRGPGATPPSPLSTHAASGFTPVQAPPWTHRLVPQGMRQAMASLGLWENPTPEPASRHLTQVSACLSRYGWCQEQDRSPVGRLCIRGAQDVLQRTGHVTAADRELAVSYMESTLRSAGISMSFFTWNDLPGQTLDSVNTLLRSASARAFRNGD